MRITRSVAFLAILALAVPAWPAETTSAASACEISPEIRAALEEHALAMAEGDDAVAAVREEYEAAAASRPDDPTPHYLLGELLAKGRDPAAGESFTRVLTIDPDFSWAHFGLVRHHAGHDRDAAKIAEHLDAFSESCPDHLQAYWYVDRVLDREVGRAITARFRDAVERRETTRATYRLKLWKAELRFAPREDVKAVRARIGKELKELENGPDSSEEGTLEALLEGYEAIRDDEGLERARKAWFTAFPDSKRSKRMTRTRWQEAHPWPGGDLGGDAMQAYAKALYEASGGWIERWPDDAEMWRDRFDATGIRRESTEDEIVQTAERLLAVYDAGAEWWTTPPLPILVARTLVRRGAGLDRVPALIDRGIEMAEEMRARFADDVPQDPLERREREMRPFVDRVEAEFLRFDGFLKQGEHGGAQTAVSDVKALLERLAPGPDDPEVLELVHRRLERDWWERRARLADAEGSRMDSLVYLQTALAVDPDGPEEAGGRDLHHNARNYFLGQGGSESAWDAWIAAGPRAVAGLASPEALWETDPRPLPELDLADLAGRRWTSDDLAGKVVLAVLWATWCGPCKWELPVIEELHREFAEVEDVVVLTLSVDQDAYVVEPFVTKAGYTFPVLLAAEYEARHDLRTGLPTTFLLDREGVIRKESRGFPSKEKDRWREVVRGMLEDLRGSTGGP